MSKHFLVRVAILDALTLVGCHNAELDASSKRTEQPASLSGSAQPAQRPAPAASSDGPSSAASAAASTAKGEPSILDGEAWVLVESENLYLPVIDELGQDLLAANLAVKAGKPPEGAPGLRSGAAYLLSLRPPDAKGKAALASAAKELNSLAQDLERGQVDAKRLARAYQQAFQADVTGHWVLVDTEETWLSYSNRPGLHLARALDELKTDPRAAATDIRQANSYLGVEELRRPNDLLRSAVQELAVLADQVEQGKVKDPSRIEDAIADSGHALAATHYHVAVDAWQRHNQSLASRELKESVAHLKHAVGRVNAETRAAVLALDRDAEILVKDAKGDVSAFAKRVEAELKQVKAELGKLRSKPNQGK